MEGIAPFMVLNRFGPGIGPDGSGAVEADVGKRVRRRIVRDQPVPAALLEY